MPPEPTPALAGLHHVTAIASQPQRNLDFWAGVLALRLVKQTVNFDDPTSYHLYYGDTHGTPGSVVTFFPWVERPLVPLPRGRRGTGQAVTVALSVPAGSLDAWVDRLVRADVDFDVPFRRFDEEVLAFTDPDGLRVELVAHDAPEARAGWPMGGVPEAQAFRGLRGVTLSLERYEATAAFLQEALGMRPAGEEAGRVRFVAGRGDAAARVDLRCQPEAAHGQTGVGSIHHVAWRTESPEALAAWRERLLARGSDVSPVMDRKYFSSIYFREPGGVLFEIATEAPGFTADESAERLGTALQLPAWLEPRRARLEATLPHLHPPRQGRWTGLADAGAEAHPASSLVEGNLPVGG